MPVQTCAGLAVFRLGNLLQQIHDAMLALRASSVNRGNCDPEVGALELR